MGDYLDSDLYRSISSICSNTASISKRFKSRHIHIEVMSKNEYLKASGVICPYIKKHGGRSQVAFAYANFADNASYLSTLKNRSDRAGIRPTGSLQF